MISRSYFVVAAFFVATMLATGGCSDETGIDDQQIDDVGNHGELDAGEDADDQSGDTGTDDTDTGQEETTDGGDDDGGDDDGGDDDGDDADDACSLAYQQECDDECVSTNTDINHCGECGNECEGEQACVGGECTTECMGDLQLCDNRCVDYDLDSSNCGSCGNECADDQGCSDGTCIPTAELDSTSNDCDDGGPILEIDTGDNDEQCTGELASETFMWALCTCDDLTTQDEFLTDGFDSTSGPYEPGSLGGGVGVNGDFSTESEAYIWGALHVGDKSTTTIGDSTEIHQQLHAGEDFHSDDQCDVGDDTYITDDINADGGLDIDGTLYSTPDVERTGNINYDNLVEQTVTVDPPCGYCDNGETLPVEDTIDAGESPNNDNDLIGLDEDLLVGADSPEHLELPCGEYYLSEIDVPGDVTIIAEGRVVLYVDGAIDVGGELSMLPEPEGELDIFVDDDIEPGDGLTLGSPNYPASTRLYIGGNTGLTLSSESQIGGNIYAVPGELYIQDSLDVFGALYAEDAVFESELSIHYDRQTIRTGQNCPTPDDDDDGDDNGDDGGDDNGDDGGDDGGDDDDPQCVYEDDPCDSDSDCCAPLICDEQTGTCGLTECLNDGETCIYDDQCCSGVCAISPDDDEGECIVG